MAVWSVVLHSKCFAKFDMPHWMLILTSLVSLVNTIIVMHVKNAKCFGSVYVSTKTNGNV